MGRLRPPRWRSQHDLAQLWTGASSAVRLNISGYHPGTGMGSVVIGTIYALVDGFVGGAVFGWLYNLLVGE